MFVKRLTTYPILLILAWSFLVHVPGITSPLLDYHAHRQCQTASMARNYLRHGMHFLNPELDSFGPPARAGTEFPIYSSLLALLYKVFGLHETLGRILSSVFAAWGAVYLFLLVRKRLDPNVALGAALVMCVIPVHLYFTRTVQPESMALWGFLGFLFYADRMLNGPKPFDGTLTLLFGALPCLLKLSFVYPIAGMWAILIYERHGWRGFLYAKGYALALGMVGLTLIWYDYAKSAPVQALPLTTGSNFENLKPIATWYLWQSHIISRFPEIYATYPGVLLGAIGAWSLRKKQQLRFFGFWFLLTFAYQILLGQYGLTHKYTAIPFAPIMGVFISMGALTLWRHRVAWRVPAWVICILVAGIPLHSALRIAHWYTLERLWVFDAKVRLNMISRPNDLVLTNTAEHPVLLYYLDRYGYAQALEQTTPAAINDILNRNVRFFITPREERWEANPEWHAYFSRRGYTVVEKPDYLIYLLNPPKAPQPL
jgi:hypothetical protein